MATLDLEKTGELLRQVSINKTRKTNELSDREIEAIISLFQENLSNIAILDEAPARQAAPATHWIGIDEANESRWDDPKKADVLNEWCKDNGIDADKVLSVRDQGVYFYSARVGTKAFNLVVFKSDKAADFGVEANPPQAA